MKTIRLIPLGFAWLAGAAGWVYAGQAADKTAYRTNVIFFESEKFTDVRDGVVGTEKGREGILDQLKTFLVERAQSYVAEGEKLTVTITDVDLAGDFEPWRSGSMRDVRIVKEIYAPRINLAFKLVGPDGETIKAGERQLRDMAFQMNASATNANDALRYEKALLEDWLRNEFRRVKKGS